MSRGGDVSKFVEFDASFFIFWNNKFIFNNLVHFKKLEYNDAKDICINLINVTCDIFQGKRFQGKVPTITVKDIEEIADLILKESNYEKDGVRTLKNLVNDTAITAISVMRIVCVTIAIVILAGLREKMECWWNF